MQAGQDISRSGLLYPVSSPRSCDEGDPRFFNPVPPGLFNQALQVLHQPGKILFIMDLQGGYREGDIVPGDDTCSHPLVEGAYRRPDDDALLFENTVKEPLNGFCFHTRNDTPN